MFLSSKKPYLLLTIISFVQLTAMQPGIKKRSLRNMMKKHHKILKKGSKLSINHLPQEIRHKLLTTAHRLDHPMFPVYLNDWVIKECAMPAYIVDMIGREITIIDIEKHLAKTKKFRFPYALYKEIGQKIAWLYIIPHIKNQAEKYDSEKDSQIVNTIQDLNEQMNQSLAVVLMYAYDAHRTGKPTLKIPTQSNAAKILGKLKYNTQIILGYYLNFTFV